MFLFNNFFNTEEITHDVLDTVFKNTQQNLSINLNHNNDGSLNVSLSNNTNYYAREYNIVNLLAYNIEHKKLDILKKYEYLNNQSYLSKLFYEIIKNGENLTDFFFYGNESQSQYKGFESLSLENKKLFFNELSSNLYLSFFESKYVEKNPEFDRKNIIKINHHQVIKNILHCLFKMTKNFDINEFPIDFFDKEATMFLMDELKKSAFNLNSNQVNNMLTSIESSIEKRKLESIIANDKLVKSNKKKI